MTRDQLIQKRKRKKLVRRVAAGATALALGLIIYGGVGLFQNRSTTQATNATASAPEEAIDGLVSVAEQTEDVTSIPEPVIEVESEDIPVSSEESPEENDAVESAGEVPSGSGPMVALTFDDGPGYYTNRLLDILDQYGAKATFFMIGQEVENYSSAVLREYQMGMEQGNHSWDHKTLTHLSGGDIREEFQKTNDAITSITGGTIELFRAPGGGINDDVYENSLGMKSILWSIDTLDWETKDADQTYNTVISEVTDGSIVLMHEIYQASVDAAERIIPKLQEMGYQLVTVSELAAAKGVTLETWQSYGSF